MAEIRINETGTLKLFDADDSHSASIKAGTISADVASITLESGETVFNEDSADIDFRVESNGNANMIFVDGGNDHVNIGTSTDLGGVLNVSGIGVFQTADNTNTLSLVCTDEDATSGPRLSMRRESASPADSDNLGQIYFTGKDSAGNNTDYVTIKVATGDVTDGTEDAQIEFDVVTGGTAREYLRLASGSEPSVVINEDSQDIDFRVESDGNANAFFVEGSTDFIGMGTNDPDSPLHVHVGSAGSVTAFDTSGVTIEDSDNATLNFLSPDSGQSRILFGSPTDNVGASIKWGHDTNAFEIKGGTGSSELQLGGAQSTQLLIQNSGNVLIGTTSGYDGEILRANKDGTNNIASFTSSNNGGAGQITITNSFSASASTDETATIRFGLGNGGAAIQAYKASDTQTAAARDVGLEFKVQDDNSEQVRFRIVNNGDLLASDTSIGSISDVRLKKDIEDLNYSIDTFKALKPRTFNWKNPWLHAGETNRRGFVAQELKEVDPYWVSEQKATKKSDDVLDPATYYEKEDEIPEGKKIGDIKTEATYTYQYEKGDGSDYDLLNDGSELDNIEMIAKLGKKDAMYISVIQQLIARIEALEG